MKELNKTDHSIESLQNIIDEIKNMKGDSSKFIMCLRIGDEHFPVSGISAGKSQDGELVMSFESIFLDNSHVARDLIDKNLEKMSKDFERFLSTYH